MPEASDSSIVFLSPLLTLIFAQYPYSEAICSSFRGNTLSSFWSVSVVERCGRGEVFCRFCGVRIKSQSSVGLCSWACAPGLWPSQVFLSYYSLYDLPTTTHPRPRPSETERLQRSGVGGMVGIKCWKAWKVAFAKVNALGGLSSFPMPEL